MASNTDLTPVQRDLLRQLARAARRCAGHDGLCADQLVDLGLARRAGAPAAYEITPAGRHHIAMAGSAAGKPPGRRASAPRRAGADAPPKSLCAVCDLQATGWSVVARCATCGHNEAIDLDLFAWRFGARTRLGGRRQACVADGCDGEAAYFGRPPGGRYAALDDG